MFFVSGNEMNQISLFFLMLFTLCASGCVSHNKQGTVYHYGADWNSYQQNAFFWEEYDYRPMRRHRVEYFRWRHPINKVALASHDLPQTGASSAQQSTIEPLMLQPENQQQPNIPPFQATPPAPLNDNHVQQQPRLETPIPYEESEQNGSVKNLPPLPPSPSQNSSEPNQDQQSPVPVPPALQKSTRLQTLHSIAQISSSRTVSKEGLPPLQSPQAVVPRNKTADKKPTHLRLLFPRLR